MKVPGNPNKQIWLNYSRKEIQCPFVVLSSKLAKRYSGLLQILKDLEIAIKAINTLLNAPKNKNFDILKHGLFCLSITSYAKCFVSTTGRIKLDSGKYISNADNQHLEMHNMIMNLRHKYISHAENTEYDQIEIVLALDPDLNKKEIANIVSISVYATEANSYLHSKFIALYTHIHAQIRQEADKCYKALRAEVENKPIEYWYKHATYPS